MIKIVQRFLRKNFCAAAKARLLDVFDQNHELMRAVILIEMAPLAGSRITYMWQELRESCRLDVREVNLINKEERLLIKRELSKSDFEKLILRIDEAGGISLGDYSGPARDGVSYSLCWGRPASNATLRIANPQVGSIRHVELIKMLKIASQERPNDGREI